MSRNKEVDMLDFIYQNSQMGVASLNEILPMVEEGKFKESLRSQLKGYKDIHEKAKNHLNKAGYDEKGIHAMQKMMTYLMIDVKMMADSSPSHVAKMLIQGSNMGIIDAQKRIHEYKGEANPEALKLMKHLQEFEEKNVERLKEYL
ncbi:MAG: hypothetical protein HFG69_16065 [Hungatella sp.]|nr:hypothetical protein [Hungatella sp.]